MKTYSVSWEIDIEAATPREATEIARRIQLDPGSTAVVFDVACDQHGVCKIIDLEDIA